MWSSCARRPWRPARCWPGPSWRRRCAPSSGSVADYLSAGPVTPTPTKPGRPGTGLGYLAYAAGSAETRPWFVTGGVTPDTVPGLVAAGARRFVVVRYLTTAADPEAAARRLRERIDAAVAD
jgi:thiamine-phosphate pyrophosphorylase